MYRNEKRFFNTQTKQIHRFIPLYENKYDNKIMGISMDSDKKHHIGNLPYISRGQMVLVDNQNKKRIGYTYKGELLYDLLKVYGGDNEFELITMKNHLSELSGYDGYRWSRVVEE